MKKIFERATVGKLALKNRLIRSATFEIPIKNEKGRTERDLARIYGDLAEGGIAAIITGFVSVCTGRLQAGGLRDYDSPRIDEFKTLAEYLHGLGVYLIPQINHAGAKERVEEPYAPSATEGKTVRELTALDLQTIATAFANTAADLKAAGADAVQLHASHGYLISQMLSPLFNRRLDEYGGSLENRARFMFLVFDAVRDAVGKDYPIWLKLNLSDLSEGGLELSEGIRLCEQLASRGAAALELSSGISTGSANSPSQNANEKGEAYFAEATLQAADRAGDASVIGVGGYRSPETIERILNRGGVDAISLSRPLIREPALAARWQSGDTKPAACVSCNRCYYPKDNLRCRAEIK
jgi:2,4-dienoyl-CoA reductase-like NADH-dependent reductase (Old Yellow Enzyme family)